MAFENKREYIKITTPKGVAIWPWLNKPNTKFDSDGTYSVMLSIPAEEAKGLMAQLNELAKKAYQQAVEILTEKGKPKDVAKIVRNEPYELETDDDGNETGNILFRFKQKSKIKTKDGKILELKPRLFDAQGKPIDADTVIIWGGSVIRVACDASTYYVPATRACGVKLQLKAVQVLELAAGNGGNASSYGFEQEEGYSITDSGSEGESSEGSGEDADASDF